MSDKIDISGLDKGEVLFALYNNGAAVGMGHMFGMMGEQITLALIQEDILQRQKDGTDLYFDYVGGRPLKVNLTTDELDPRLYDRDNGEGAAARVIRELRTGMPEPREGQPGRYNKERCQLPQMIQMGLQMGGGRDAENPCAGCNHDRSICGGAPKEERC